jgi:hypothetical protein
MESITFGQQERRSMLELEEIVNVEVGEGKKRLVEQ